MCRTPNAKDAAPYPKNLTSIALNPMKMELDDEYRFGCKHLRDKTSSLQSLSFAHKLVIFSLSAEIFFEISSEIHLPTDVEEREKGIDVEETVKKRDLGLNLQGQRLASWTAPMLVAQNTRPVEKSQLRDKL